MNFKKNFILNFFILQKYLVTKNTMIEIKIFFKFYMKFTLFIVKIM